MTQKYPKGSSVTVYYDPKTLGREDINGDPESPDSVLEPGLNLECLYPLAIFLLPLTLALLVGYRLAVGLGG